MGNPLTESPDSCTDTKYFSPSSFFLIFPLSIFPLHMKIHPLLQILDDILQLCQQLFLSLHLLPDRMYLRSWGPFFK